MCYKLRRTSRRPSSCDYHLVIEDHKWKEFKCQAILLLQQFERDDQPPTHMPPQEMVPPQQMGAPPQQLCAPTQQMGPQQQLGLPQQRGGIQRYQQLGAQDMQYEQQYNTADRYNTDRFNTPQRDAHQRLLQQPDQPTTLVCESAAGRLLARSESITGSYPTHHFSVTSTNAITRLNTSDTATHPSHPNPSGRCHE